MLIFRQWSKYKIFALNPMVLLAISENGFIASQFNSS
jgi:hypothetical protein